jgi:hypothetical protein
VAEKSEQEKLEEALLFLWNLRKRHEPALVVINITDRAKARGILGRDLCKKLGI